LFKSKIFDHDLVVLVNNHAFIYCSKDEWLLLFDETLSGNMTLVSISINVNKALMQL